MRFPLAHLCYDKRGYAARGTRAAPLVSDGQIKDVIVAMVHPDYRHW
jgi:hypothetical protein